MRTLAGRTLRSTAEHRAAAEKRRSSLLRCATGLLCRGGLLALLSACNLFADALGEISGTVMDRSGGVVTGASVFARNTETEFIRSARSADDGSFVLAALPPGPYEVAADQEGFRRLERGGIRVETGKRHLVDIVLDVGSSREIVRVVADASLLESDSATIGHVAGTESTELLPLNGRNYLQLAATVPGASGVGYSTPGTIMSGERPTDQRPGSELFVNGNREQSNSVLLDGVDNTFRRNGLIALRPSLESIREIAIRTSLYSAEHGGKSGAAINIVTKSGSNAFHGSAFEFLRNSVLDARNPFSPERTAFRQNQFGASFGGPLVRNRLFFFADYEGSRKRLEETSVNTVPSGSIRGGDFGGRGGSGARESCS